ncbi:MAG TPA: hypothetical protein VFU21_12585 [Kofleriaceae bacterium]|nr:hypothetical protein [Kofleriaceae bacterium]
MRRAAGPCALLALCAGCELILLADKADQIEDDLDTPTAELDATGPVIELAPGALAEFDVHIASSVYFRAADVTLTGSTRALAAGGEPGFDLELEEYECVTSSCRDVAIQRHLYAGDEFELTGRLTCEGDCLELPAVLRVELADGPIGIEVVWAIEVRIEGPEEEDASLVIEAR